MSSETYKAIVRKWVDEMNKGNVDVMEELFHPDFIDNNPFAGFEPNKQGYISLLKLARGEWFPGYIITIEDLVCENDRLAFRVSVKAQHNGNFMNIPATGKDIAWTGFGILRFKDNQIIERWELFDSFTLMEQVGAIKLIDQ